MKRFIVLTMLCILFIGVQAEDFLTIYNQNQALFKTNIELDLQRGVQFFSFENIPTTIVTESVIFLPRNRNVQLFAQNFEYDLANSQKMMQRYINREIRISTETEQFSGTLMFFDFGNYGLLNEATNELNIVNAQEVVSVLLPEMPSDFYTKPTLRWQLNAERAGKYEADLSYLLSGVNWRATYNVVLSKNDFALNSWVTINNRSGKDFQNVKLKLIAGEVQTHQQLARGMQADMMMMERSYSAPPAFEEREFSDFRIFTLDQPADIDNNQEKQLSLYPLKTVRYTRKYQYEVQGRAVDIMINFTNSTQAGLGVPLPAGNVNFYEIDDRDNTQQFVGVSRINNTSINQDLDLRIGSAFDIVAETNVLRSQTTGRTRETDFEVKITNNKSEAIEIEVIRNIYSSNVEILNPSVQPERKDAFTSIFRVRVASGRTETITFMERINN